MVCGLFFFFFGGLVCWRGKRDGVACGRAAEFGCRGRLAGDASPPHPTGGPAPAAPPPRGGRLASAGGLAARRCDGARRRSPWPRGGPACQRPGARAPRTAGGATSPPLPRGGGVRRDRPAGSPRGSACHRAGQRRWRRAGGGATVAGSGAAAAPQLRPWRGAETWVAPSVARCARGPTYARRGCGWGWQQQQGEAARGAPSRACARGTRSRRIGCTPVRTRTRAAVTGPPAVIDWIPRLGLSSSVVFRSSFL